MSKGLEALNKVAKWCDIQIVDEELYIIGQELKDFEWLKSILNIDFFDSLEAEDKVKLLNIMGAKINYEQKN